MRTPSAYAVNSPQKSQVSPQLQKALAALTGQKAVLYQIMDELDCNKDGQLSVLLLRERLVQLMSTLHEGLHLDQSDLIQMADAFHVNRDGKISRCESALEAPA